MSIGRIHKDIPTVYLPLEYVLVTNIIFYGFVFVTIGFSDDFETHQKN